MLIIDLRKIFKTLLLPEGTFQTEVLSFDESDRKTLRSIYIDWRKLCQDLNSLDSRGINLPEGLSESAFCLEMDCYRITKSISGANTSFDAYDPFSKSRIQVKACSVLPDLTSFGPRSVWDKLFFVDFYRNGDWNGLFDIYFIENNLIYNHKVNSQQTFKDQQEQNRRPRFSIYREIILERKIQPIKTGNLNI